MHVTVSIEGINLERLLRAAADAGIAVAHARRMGGRAMRLRVRADQLEQLRALCEASGWHMDELRAGGLVRAARLLCRRKLLLPAMIMSALLVALSQQMILRVRVEHAGAHEAEIRRFFAEEGVRPGRLKAAFSLDKLRAALALRLPGLSFAGLRYAGSTLICDGRQAVQGESLAVAGDGEDIVAAQAGIVSKIYVQSGTPQVQPGQVVHKGQLLIAGYERTEKGKTVPVRAQGEVQARVFAKGEARASLMETVTVETGQTRTRVALRTPWHHRETKSAAPFASQDISREWQSVVGLYLPLWREKEIMAETAVFKTPRSRSDAASMAQGAAEEIAKKQCPYGALIIDKWVNYSMIDNEFVYATVVLEYETAIAGRTKQ